MIYSLLKTRALLGINLEKYPISNIIDLDLINKKIEETIIKSKGTELIFIFGTELSDIEYYDYKFEIDDTSGMLEFKNQFSFYYDITFFDMLKKYQESGYTVFLLYTESKNGINIINATINWNPNGMSIFDLNLPDDSYKVISIEDIGISSNGMIVIGK